LELLEHRHVLAANPMITEFMASNRGTLDDGDGTSSDWIEIYNAGDEVVNLAGYRLTDNADSPSRWVFPDVTLQPNEFVVVFASSQNVDNYVDAAGYLHTNFALNASGEYLALLAPDGTVVSEFGSKDTEYPPQRPNVSYGVGQSVNVVQTGSDTFSEVPLDGSVDTTWTEPNFDERTQGFSLGKAALGMECNPLGRGNLANEIITELPPRSHGVYARTHFLVDDAADVRQLTLSIKYDNGFAAYLNGNPVESDNAPAELRWFTKAPKSRPADRDAVVFKEFDLSDHRDKLVTGDNVLAIHGLNHIPRDQGDMLLAFELQAVMPSVGGPGYIRKPTPGSANNDAFGGLVEDTNFSLGHGFYNSPQVLEITTATEGAQVYYSTDGSYPGPTNANATLYDKPLTIDATTSIRAAAFKPGFMPSNVDTRTFLFVDDVADQAAMKSAITEDLVWGPQIRASLLSVPSISLVTNCPVREGVAVGEIEASVELMHPDGTEGFQIDAGFEHFGGVSLTLSNKKHIRISYKAIYGASRLRYDLFGHGSVNEFDQLLLHTGSHDRWFHSGSNPNNRGI
jgi:hypothetical protein